MKKGSKDRSRVEKKAISFLDLNFLNSRSTILCQKIRAITPKKITVNLAETAETPKMKKKRASTSGKRGGQNKRPRAG
jgi:hypothetical protein